MAREEEQEGEKEAKQSDFSVEFEIIFSNGSINNVSF